MAVPGSRWAMRILKRNQRAHTLGAEGLPSFPNRLFLSDPAVPGAKYYLQATHPGRATARMCRSNLEFPGASQSLKGKRATRRQARRKAQSANRRISTSESSAPARERCLTLRPLYQIASFSEHVVFSVK